MPHRSGKVVKDKDLRAALVKEPQATLERSLQRALHPGPTPTRLAAALHIPLLHASPYHGDRAYVILADDDVVGAVQHALGSGARRLVVVIDPASPHMDAIAALVDAAGAEHQLVTYRMHVLDEQLESFADAMSTALGPLEAVVQPLTASSVMRTITRRVRSLVGEEARFAVHEPLWPVLCECAGGEREADVAADALTRCLQGELPSLRGSWSWRTGSIRALARRAVGAGNIVLLDILLVVILQHCLSTNHVLLFFADVPCMPATTYYCCFFDIQQLPTITYYCLFCRYSTITNHHVFPHSARCCWASQGSHRPHGGRHPSTHWPEHPIWHR